MLFGRGHASVKTSREISKAGELARWVVIQSGLHPINRDDVVMPTDDDDGRTDQLTKVGGGTQKKAYFLLWEPLRLGL